MTNKHQMSVSFLLTFLFEKRTGQADLFSFQKESTKKTFADIWCLVIGFYSMAYPMKRRFDQAAKLTYYQSMR